jgi:hypothetical protein
MLPYIEHDFLMEGVYFPEVFGRSDGGKFTVTSDE